MKTSKKKFTPPQIRVIELRQNPCLLAGSGEGNGDIDPNPNIPI